MNVYYNQNIKFYLLLIVFCFLFIGCAGPKPILYPNNHLKSVGQEQAEIDIAACKELAGQNVSSSGGGKVVKSTAMGAGLGAASGAVGGAIRGSASRGSLVGAAAGATAGLIRGLFRLSNEPNQTYVALVNHCLRDKGYESVGWD